jgi:hypothetical protein
LSLERWKGKWKGSLRWRYMGGVKRTAPPCTRVAGLVSGRRDEGDFDKS